MIPNNELVFQYSPFNSVEYSIINVNDVIEDKETLQSSTCQYINQCKRTNPMHVNRFTENNMY